MGSPAELCRSRSLHGTVSVTIRAHVDGGAMVAAGVDGAGHVVRDGGRVYPRRMQPELVHHSPSQIVFPASLDAVELVISVLLYHDTRLLGIRVQRAMGDARRVGDAPTLQRTAGDGIRQMRVQRQQRSANLRSEDGA